MTALEELIAQVEAAGFSWAIACPRLGYYTAVLEPAPDQFIGDSLVFAGAEDGDTPLAALQAAFDYRLKQK